MSDAVSPSGNLLRQEYDRWRERLHMQPLATQRFLAAQAQRLGDSLVSHAASVRFALPDQVVAADHAAGPVSVPVKYRDQLIGRSGLIGRLSPADLCHAARQRLQALELVNQAAVSCAANLLRYSTALYLVHERLPDGHELDVEFGLGVPTRDEVPADTLLPVGPVYWPEWAVVDAYDCLLVKSLYEAEEQLAAMRCYVEILDLAQTLAIYIVTDDEYRRKHFGMLQQLLEQGCALARHETKALIADIKNMAAQHELDQGMRLSLPYFDDRTLGLRERKFDVTPAGRVMFVPTFVVQAARREQSAVLADLRLSAGTRQHLLHELKLLEQAFDDGAAEDYHAWQQLYEQAPGHAASTLRGFPK